MASSPPQPRSPKLSGRVLIAQRQGAFARVLVGKFARSGLIVEKISSVPISTNADRLAMATMAAKAKPDVIAVLIPVARTSAHTPKVDAPTGSAADIASAINLLAEAHLPSTYLPHRRGGFVLGNGEQARAVIVGWTGDADPLGLPRVDVWVPELAVLAFACNLGTSVNAGAAYADTTTGGFGLVDLSAEPAPSAVGVELTGAMTGPMSVGVAAGSLTAVRARCTVLAPPNSTKLLEMAGKQVKPLVDEGKVELLFDEVSGIMLALPKTGPARAAATSAAGGGESPIHSAMLQLTGRMLADGAMANATEMTALPAEAQQSVVVRVISTLGKPKVALVCSVLALTLMIAAPFGFAYARLTTLRTAAEKVAGGDAPVEQAQGQLDLYEMLNSKRLPMTRLLAELTVAAPQGILLDLFSLEHGKRVSLSGSFSESQQVTNYRDALIASRVFEDVKIPQTDSSSQRFQINAQVSPAAVVAMTAKTRPAATALASSTAAATAATSTAISTTTSSAAPAAAAGAATAAKPDAAPRSGGANNNDRRTSNQNRGNTPRSTAPAATGGARASGGSGNTAAPASGSATPAPAAVKAVPEPISETAINAMDWSAAMKEWSVRRRESQRTDIDEATKARLTEEAVKVKARMDAAKPNSSTGGGS